MKSPSHRESRPVAEPARRPRRRRKCVTCRAWYVGETTRNVDPRCPRCAALLGNSSAGERETGAGD